MGEMADYEYTEQDIEKVTNYLKYHNPENADRDYAIQLLERMQDKAFDIVHSTGLTEEEIEKALNSSIDPKN
jgi:hypothetical protein